MRAHQVFLGRVEERRSVEDTPEVRTVTFTPMARRLLQRQLFISGRLRGGLLYGCRIGAELEIRLVSSLGPYWWLNPLRGPLELDPGYVLGCTDVLEAMEGGRVDWVGQWIAQADSQLPGLPDTLKWLNQAGRSGLVDSLQPLVVAGWDNGLLTGRAYAYEEGEAVEWACRFDV